MRRQVGSPTREWVIGHRTVLLVGQEVRGHPDVRCDHHREPHGTTCRHANEGQRAADQDPRHKISTPEATWAPTDCPNPAGGCHLISTVVAGASVSGSCRRLRQGGAHERRRKRLRPRSHFARIGPMLIAHGPTRYSARAVWPAPPAGRGAWAPPGRVHARMAAATEIGAGTLITLGVANPLPTAAVVGLMATAAATDHG